jgi:hypothetical protein
LEPPLTDAARRLNVRFRIKALLGGHPHPPNIDSTTLDAALGLYLTP